MKSLFTGIDSSSHTAVSLIVIAKTFFKSMPWNLLSRIPFPDSGFRIPCFSAALCATSKGYSPVDKFVTIAMK